MFDKLNFEVVCACNGQEAYEKFVEENKNSGEMFDLVVLDLNMPVANGYEACKNIISSFN